MNSSDTDPRGGHAEGPDNSHSNSPPERAQTIEAKIRNKFNGDIVFYSGEILAQESYLFCQFLSQNKNRENLIMILCTPGGDIHSAYRMVRHIRRLYGGFILYCFGICKSAGTLVALGADAIRMSEFSELGPLDVQIAKPDEFFKRTSGLDMTAAVQTLGQQTYKRFEASFLDLKRNSGDIITTKTAAQIASEMAVGLFRPISEQIDPLRLGENFRQLQIALEYGRRLDVKEQILMKLIENYPSHDFVIDLDEAKTLFSHVDLLDEDDVAFEKALQEQTIEKYAEDVIHFPPQYGQPIYAHVVSSTEEETSPEAPLKANCASDNIMVNRVKIGLTTDPWHPNEEVLK